MIALRTNVKGLISAIILSTVLINIKGTYILQNSNRNNANNIKQIHNYQKQLQTKTITEPVKSKSQNNAITKTTANTDNSKQQLARNKPNIEKQPSRGGNIDSQLDIVLTFYSSLGVENGGYTGINCRGKKLLPGTVANNILPLGTKIYTEEFGTLTVEDRGGNNFNTIHRLDVYVPRKAGENDSEYLKRVNDMGRVRVIGYIIT
jgi:3D (Asp-Asp-Asp) domain-containing protein